MRIYKFLLVFISALLIASCANKHEDDEEKIEPAAKLFAEAEALMSKAKYKDASKVYSRIYFQHPASADGAKAELGEAFALYQLSKYEEAVDVIDDFIHLHPVHMETAYAYHLKALCYYMQIPNVYRDQSITEKALKALQEVTERYPNSKYAIDASLKIDLVLDHLAGKEMEIGRLYLKKSNPIAAIPRFQAVIEKYETTSHAPEALHRLVEAALMLGLRDEALKYASVLGHNYPESIWYRYSTNLLKAVDAKKQLQKK